MTTPAVRQEPAEEGLSRVTTFWAALPADDAVSAALWRLVERGQPEFLGKYFLTLGAYPDEYAFYDEVKADHGGGKYELRVTTPGGQWTAKPSFCIGGKPKRDEEEKTVATGSGTDRMADLIAQGQRNTEALLARILEKPSGDDELARLERYAAIVTKNQQPVQPAEKSFIERAVEKQFLSFMENGMGAQKEEAGFGWIMEAANAFGPTLMAKLMEGGATGAAPAQTATAATQPAAIEDQAAVLQRIKNMLVGMVQLAAYKTPIDANTVQILKEQAGENWEKLANVIRQPQVVDMAAQLVPEVKNHRAWFEKLRAQVMSEESEQKQGAAGGSTTRKPAVKAAKKPAVGAGKKVANG